MKEDKFRTVREVSGLVLVGIGLLSIYKIIEAIFVKK
jgi:hypothetical protein